MLLVNYKMVKNYLTSNHVFLAAKQKAMDALTAADVVVFAFPLWNLTIPAPLQTFIDYTYQAGYSFKYDENGQPSKLNDR